MFRHMSDWVWLNCSPKNIDCSSGQKCTTRSLHLCKCRCKSSQTVSNGTSCGCNQFYANTNKVSMFCSELFSIKVGERIFVLPMYQSLDEFPFSILCLPWLLFDFGYHFSSSKAPTKQGTGEISIFSWAQVNRWYKLTAWRLSVRANNKSSK